MAFLVWGDVHDGAPTHHPARALAPVWWILLAMGTDTLDVVARRSVHTRRYVAGAAALAGVAWCASLPSRWAQSPGRSDSERRDAQIARGQDMRARGVARAEVTPCSFEHFALLAAWGAPERAKLLPRTGESVGPACPHVVEE
jgi:hypothetical protein